MSIRRWWYARLTVMDLRCGVLNATSKNVSAREDEWTAVIPDAALQATGSEPLFLRDGLFYFHQWQHRYDMMAHFSAVNLSVSICKDYYANIDGVEDLAYARFLLAENMV